MSGLGARCSDKPGRQSGYTLLAMVFLVAVVLVAVMAATPVILTEGKREREEEMVWRGQQYARGIRLYFRKYGRYPQSLEDVTKRKDNIHFMRKAYKDPMNTEDGSWRLIYIGPGGQLIGSTKQRTLLQFPGANPSQHAPQEPVGSMLSREPGTRRPPDRSAGASDSGAGSSDPLTGKVFGGNIIGVASKVSKPSIRVYDGASNYHDWEFIWDITKEAALVVPTTPGATPPGTHRPERPPQRFPQ